MMSPFQLRGRVQQISVAKRYRLKTSHIANDGVIFKERNGKNYSQKAIK